MQYLNKKKNMFGEKVGPGAPGMQDNRFTLDQMNLDRKDQGNDNYDPFYKVNVRRMLFS
jgi:hypothetical protein